jgi:hypothetical protein
MTTVAVTSRAALALVAAAVLSACEGAGASRAEAPAAPAATATRSRAGLLPQARPPEADLPVPVGFALAEAISRTFQPRGLRFVDHTYRGEDPPVMVERFCREQLPRHRWRLESAQLIRGEHRLRFVREAETCEVRIARDRGAAGDGDPLTALHYVVQPAPAPGSGSVGRADDSPDVDDDDSAAAP